MAQQGKERKAVKDFNLGQKHRMRPTELNCIKNYCIEKIDLRGELGDEYFYQSLPLCVIDAVYSIGVRYSSTKRVIERYCQYFSITKMREYRNEMPPEESQESIEEFQQKINNSGSEEFAKEIFKNKQRTSTKSGILKSEAVLQFANVLKKYEVNYFQHIDKIISNEDFENDIKLTPGQNSGISLKYFFMLAGLDKFIKPDRWILKFIKDILNLNRVVTHKEAQECLTEVCEMLKPKYPNLTPRLFDHIIWKYERKK